MIQLFDFFSNKELGSDRLQLIRSVHFMLLYDIMFFMILFLMTGFSAGKSIVDVVNLFYMLFPLISMEFASQIYFRNVLVNYNRFDEEKK